MKRRPLKFRILVVATIFFNLGHVFAQKYIQNTSDGYMAEGYDVVEYFKGVAKEGSVKYRLEFRGVLYKFISEENKEIFKKNPVKYVPQFGGYCAYALAHDKGLMKIDPETFEIRNGKLYLFYHTIFNNTYEDWIKENPDQLLKEAYKNWNKIVDKK